MESMKKYPEDIYYIGNTDLLKKPKISIVGTRRPIAYTKMMVNELSRKLSANGICIVSGAAMGVDALAHKGAGEQNTIAVMANGLDIIYPKVNKSLITTIQEEGLTLSQFEPSTPSHAYNFVIRNELVVALGDALIVCEADIGSGTMRSVEFALKMNKDIYVLPHRLGESLATQKLLQEEKAKAIYDIDAFVALFSTTKNTQAPIDDNFTLFCQTHPFYEDAIKTYGDLVYEAELEGKIIIKNARIHLI